MTAQIPEDLKLLYGETTRVDTILKERGHTLPRSYIPVLIERIAALTQENATLREENARLSAPVSDQQVIVNSLLIRLNERLLDIRPDWDDSLTGFNEAMEIVRDVLRNPITLCARKEDRRDQYETTQYPSCDAAGKESK